MITEHNYTNIDSNGYLICPFCGRGNFSWLSRHLTQYHGISIDSLFKECFPDIKLVTDDMHKKLIKAGKRTHELHPGLATEVGLHMNKVLRQNPERYHQLKVKAGRAGGKISGTILAKYYHTTYRKEHPEKYHEQHVRAGHLAGKRAHELHPEAWWRGGVMPSYGYNWNKQRQLAMERADYKCEVTGLSKDVTKLDVHHKISVRNCHIWFIKRCYPNLYTIMIENGNLLFGLFEQKVKKGHKDYRHYKGIPVESVFPKCFYDIINHLDNLIVMNNSEHHRITHKKLIQFNQNLK